MPLHHYTKHGQHFNKRGKWNTASIVLDTIKEINLESKVHLNIHLRVISSKKSGDCQTSIHLHTVHLCLMEGEVNQPQK